MISYSASGKSRVLINENEEIIEILDIFAYNVPTKGVVSSGKTSWSATGNEKYYEVTGEK